MIKILEFAKEKIPISIAYAVNINNTIYIWYPFLKKKYFYKSENKKQLEELVRAFTVKRLIIDYGYSPEAISFENKVFNTGRLDILLKNPENNKPFAVFELAYEKNPANLHFDIVKGIEEARKLQAKYFVHIVKEKWFIFDVEQNKEVADFPTNFGLTKKFRYIKGKKGKDLAYISISDLKKIFNKVHNILWGQGEIDPLDAMEITIELLIAKRYDEISTKPNEYYKFQVAKISKSLEESAYDVVYRVSSIIDNLFKDKIHLLKGKNKRIDNKIKKIVNNNPNIVKRLKEVIKLLEGYSLSSLKEDELGHAFELFLSTMFRGPYGQYFTPPSIVKLMVEIADIQADDFVVDLSAGSGRILQYALESIKRKKGYIPRTFKIFGADIYEKIVSFANKYFLLITEDMETGHIIQCNSLSDHSILEKFLPYQSVSKVITNPPLSKKPIEISDLEIFKGKSKSKKSISPSVLFIKEYFKYLKENGLLITVIDEGVLNTKSYTNFRKDLLQKYDLIGVIRLARHTFIPSGADVQTSILVLSKKGDGFNSHSYVNQKVFFAHLEDVGFDATGRPSLSAVEYIKEKFFEFLQGKDLNDKFGANIVFTIDRDKILSNATYRMDFGYYYHTQISNNLLTIKYKAKTKPIKELSGIKVFKGITFDKEEYTDEETSVYSLKAVNIRELGLVNAGFSKSGSFIKKSALKKKKKVNILDLVIKDKDILILCSAHNPEYIYKKIAIFDNDLIYKEQPILRNKIIIPSGEIIVIRQSELHPYYLLWVLKFHLKDLIRAGVTGISGHIYPEDILSLEIPILDYSFEIGEKYKSELLKIRELEQEIEKKLKNIQDIGFLAS